MKKITYMILALALLAISACDENDAVLFKDESTAITADRKAWTITSSSFSTSEVTNGSHQCLLDRDRLT